MLKIDIKTIRNDYNHLAIQVNNHNCNPLDLDLITRARQISKENIAQVFSQRHGKMISIMTKSVANAIFIIILDETNGKMELSPYIHIKQHNGKIIMTWNIKEDTIIFNT